MADLLQEYFDSRGLALRVDRANGVIRGIKILGPHSRNGRDYLPDALTRAVSLYEGAKVNVNHPKGHPLAPRDYQERMGVIRNVSHREGEGLFGDFHFNPKHYLSEQLMWDAEHAPESVGFSHNVQARTRRQGERTVIDEIVQVHSVDLVADPATTRGLFEDFSTGSAARGDEKLAEDGSDSTGAHAATETESIDSCATLGESRQGNERICQEQAAEIAKLRTEIDELRAQVAGEQRRNLVRSLLAEYHLPDLAANDRESKAIVSEAFVQSLLTASDEPAMRRLIEDRAALLSKAERWPGGARPWRGGPLSRDQIALDPSRVVDGKSFAKAISSVR